jgi:hypothetical protein
MFSTLAPYLKRTPASLQAATNLSRTCSNSSGLWALMLCPLVVLWFSMLCSQTMVRYSKC